MGYLFVLVALANALQLGQVSFLYDAAPRVNLTCIDVGNKSTAQALGATSKANCAGHVPNEDVVTLNEMIFILQQVEVAGVAASLCGGWA